VSGVSSRALHAATGVVERLGEGLEARLTVQLAPHPESLAALSAEQDGQPPRLVVARRDVAAGSHGRWHPVIGESVQNRAQFGEARGGIVLGGGNREPKGELSTGRGE
jgi:hypothetical protein